MSVPVVQLSPIRQHMTSRAGKCAAYFSVTYRDFPGFSAVDVHSLVVSGHWRTMPCTKFLHISIAQVDNPNQTEAVIVDHLSNMIGYAEYIAKTKFMTPYVSIDRNIVDGRLSQVLVSRGYALDAGAWTKRVYRDPDVCSQ
jgi:hypothetical protein